MRFIQGVLQRKGLHIYFTITRHKEQKIERKEKNKNILKKVLTNKKPFVIIINVVGADNSQMGA